MVFLDAHGIGGGAIDATPIGEGHSNVTYLIERDGAGGAAPPAPPAAAPERPRRAARGPPAASAARHTRTRAGCAGGVRGRATIGAPFYVMELVEGEVIVASLPAALDTPAERRRIGEQLIDSLVEIHAVDWRAVGLEGFGKPTGYLERQLRRFGGLWELNKTREIPAVESVGGGWPSTCRIRPGDDRPRRLSPGQHDVRARRTRAAGGGARLGDGHDRRPVGGHRLPVHDVGAGRRPHRGPARPARQRHAAEGFPTRAEMIARYEERSGRSVGDIRWYMTLALWKSVVFMEGNYKRAIAGTTDDPYLPQFGEGVLELATAPRRWPSVTDPRRAPALRPADRLGRRAHDQPVRVLPRPLRGGGIDPGCANASKAIPTRASC